MMKPTETETEKTSPPQEMAADLESPPVSEPPAKDTGSDTENTGQDLKSPSDSSTKKSIPGWAKYAAVIVVSLIVALAIALPLSKKNISDPGAALQTYKIEVTEYSTWSVEREDGRFVGFGAVKGNMPRFGEDEIQLSRPRSNGPPVEGVVNPAEGTTVELVVDALAVGHTVTILNSHDDNVTMNDRTYLIELENVDATEATLVVTSSWVVREDCGYTARIRVPMEGGGSSEVDNFYPVGSCSWDDMNALNNLSMDVMYALTATVTAN